MVSEKIFKVFFSIISLILNGSFMLPMAIMVQIQSGQKPIAAFPLHYKLYMKFDHNLPDFGDALL